MHIDSIAIEDNLRDIKDNLERLPESIDATYDNAMRRLRDQDSRKVLRAEDVLTFVVCAMRPLKIDELRWALSIRPGDTCLNEDALPKVDYLLSACCGLVISDNESQIVRLVHYTAEEYFQGQQLFRDSKAHERIVCALLTYLNFDWTIPKLLRTQHGSYMQSDEGGEISRINIAADIDAPIEILEGPIHETEERDS